jgi:dihydroorotase
MILKNARILDPEIDLDDFLDIKIDGGKITEIGKNISGGRDAIDLSGKVIAPAFVEMHCHLREPGFEEKETIETGTRAAIAGGYAAICPMANTNPVNDNLETLSYILNRAKGRMDVFPICALTKNLEGKEINDLERLKHGSAIAFSDDGKPIENMALLFKAMGMARELDALIISHAEDSSIGNLQKLSWDVAVARELEVLRNVNCRYHFAHVSTKRSIELIRQAKMDGLRVTCETAPHYFALSKADGANGEARFKVNPPLGDGEDVAAIMEGLKDGTIDAIATDHAPHTVAEKRMSWADAPMGIAGFETAFGVSATYLSGHLSLVEIIKKLSCNPAKILALPHGRLRVGTAANMAVIDEACEWVVLAADFESQCKISPFEGVKLSGKVVCTVVNGRMYGDVQN